MARREDAKLVGLEATPSSGGYYAPSAPPYQQQQPMYYAPHPQPQTYAQPPPAHGYQNSSHEHHHHDHHHVVVVSERPEVNHACHCLLFLFTGGLWTPCWLGACCCGCCERPCGC